MSRFLSVSPFAVIRPDVPLADEGPSGRPTHFPN
jgi:hypothetical protein